jgi:predicted TIM-barrel fold metal-dependent hydrolase
MSNVVGMALYSRAGELGMPVGFMCFKGLKLHFDEIVEVRETDNKILRLTLQQLLRASPQTAAIIDHWGFFRRDGEADEDSWEKLLLLSEFPQVT